MGGIKKAPFQSGQRHFFDSFGLLQMTQRITAIPATIRARHPTNASIARSLITGSLRIMSSTEMPHLAVLHMHAFCSAAKSVVHIWLTLKISQSADSVWIVRRMDDRLRTSRRMRRKAELHQAAYGLRPARRTASVAPPKIDLFQQDGLQPDLNLRAPARCRSPSFPDPIHDPEPHAPDDFRVSDIIVINKANFPGTRSHLMHWSECEAFFKRDYFTTKPRLSPPAGGVSVV